jgi:hypothetical protein
MLESGWDCRLLLWRHCAITRPGRFCVEDPWPGVELVDGVQILPRQASASQAMSRDQHPHPR